MISANMLSESRSLVHLESGAQPESDLHPSTRQKHALRLSKPRREERKKERKKERDTITLTLVARLFSRPEKRKKFKNEANFLHEILNDGVSQVISPN